MKRKLILISISLTVIIVGYLLWNLRDSGEEKGRNPETRLVKVIRGDLNLTVSSTGVIEPISQVEIKSKASGLIVELRVEEGDTVKKGDLIARLDQRDALNDYKQAKADLEVAEASVKEAESNFRRQKELYEKG
ncbi:MAG: efflux RND transporter periplasmic adaptor subunit, partial [Fidelibacterota bacterium]